MVAPPAGISEADWSLWPADARQLVLAQQQEIDQLTALAAELASLRERIGRSLRNSSKSLQKNPPTSPFSTAMS